MARSAKPARCAISTVDNLLAFAEALRSDRLLGPAMTATVTTGKVPVGDPGRPPTDSYGYGFGDSTVNGVRRIGHNGGSPGYEGQPLIYPDSGQVPVILTNQDRALEPALRRA